MRDAENAGFSPAMVETIAGLSAGSIATLTVHPLDIVKTRMQIYRHSTPSGVSPQTPLTTVALLRSLLQTQNPVQALYRGLTPNLVGNAASWSSFFFFKSRFERMVLSLKETPPLRAQHQKGGDFASGARGREAADARPQLTPTDYFVSSGLAGVAVQLLTNPIWVLKTRMLSSDRGAEGAYPSMLEGARRVLRNEGWRGFYRGLGVSLIGVSHGAVQFAVYEPVKAAYLARQPRTLRRTQKGAKSGEGAGATGLAAAPVMTNEATLVISTAAKLVAGAATYPYQVVRSRLQNYDAEARFGRGIIGVTRLLWREDGIRGFYRGLVPGVVRVLPATWVTFLVYENVRLYLNKPS